MYLLFIYLGFPGGLCVKNLSASAGDANLIPGSQRPPGGGNGNPLQYSCLGNPWPGKPGRLQPRSHKESDMTERALTLTL